MSDFRDSLPDGLRKPAWLKKPSVRAGDEVAGLGRLLGGLGLNTVCREARCPNLNECWGRRTATFMLLGAVCTRRCGYCAVETGRGAAPDPDEPARVAAAAAAMGLRHVVITSVTRDDVRDGGSGQFARTIRELRARLPEATVEVLIPDFKGNPLQLAAVLEAGPDVLNHNIETVPRLFPRVRPQGSYRRSLELLRRVGELAPGTGVRVKSGMMVGLGETDEEVRQVLGDLRDHGVGMVTIGQYLRPTLGHAPVDRYVAPETFDLYRQWAEELGFGHVAAGPFVRSSFNAGEAMAAVVSAQAGRTGSC